MKKYSYIVLLFLLSFQTTTLFAQTINAAGSSAAAPIYEAWSQGYKKATGIELKYDAVGSSAGVSKIKVKATDFGASDVMPSAAESSKDGLIGLPIAITGVAPVVNLTSVRDGQLRLTGDVLARIFLGEITQWNAPEIVQLNPDLAMPKLAIKVIVRSEGSGTTYNFADYLAKVSTPWQAKYGVKNRFDWPSSYTQVKGSDGVVKAVKESTGAIGYVDFGYAKQNKLTTVQLKNAEGVFVKPTSASFSSALSASEWSTKGTFTKTLRNQAGENSWPIAMGTFAVLPQVTDQTTQTTPALKFLVWGLINGDKLFPPNGYQRLPDKVQASAFKVISSIVDKSGNSIGMSSIASTLQR